MSNKKGESVIQRVKRLRAYFESGLEEAISIEKELEGIYPSADFKPGPLSQREISENTLKSQLRRGVHSNK